MIKTTMKPTEVGSTLFKIKGEIESILSSVQQWRESGVESSNVVPIETLNLETKLRTTLLEVDSMIRTVSNMKYGKKKK